MMFTLQSNWDLDRKESGWRPSKAWRQFDDLDHAIRSLRHDANLSRCVSDLRVIDDNGKVYAKYETEQDMRLPGCRWRTIQRNAHALWKSAGKPESDGVEFWLEAEEQIDENQIGVSVG